MANFPITKEEIVQDEEILSYLLEPEPGHWGWFSDHVPMHRVPDEIKKTIGQMERDAWLAVVYYSPFFAGFLAGLMALFMMSWAPVIIAGVVVTPVVAGGLWGYFRSGDKITFDQVEDIYDKTHTFIHRILEDMALEDIGYSRFQIVDGLFGERKEILSRTQYATREYIGDWFKSHTPLMQKEILNEVRAIVSSMSKDEYEDPEAFRRIIASVERSDKTPLRQIRNLTIVFGDREDKQNLQRINELEIIPFNSLEEVQSNFAKATKLLREIKITPSSEDTYNAIIEDTPCVQEFLALPTAQVKNEVETSPRKFSAIKELSLD